MPRRLAAIALAGALAAVPAGAAAAEPESDAARRLDELKEDLGRFFDGLIEEVEPALDSLARTMETLERVDGLEHYHEPEVLENGDILLRRREDAPPLPPGARDEEAPDLPLDRDPKDGVEL